MKHEKNLATQKKRKLLFDFNLRRKQGGLDPVARLEISTDDELDTHGYLLKGVEQDNTALGAPLVKKFRERPVSPMSILFQHFTEAELAMIAEDLTYFVLDDRLRLILSKTLVGKTWDELLAEEEDMGRTRTVVVKSSSAANIFMRPELTQRLPFDHWKSQEKLVTAQLARDRQQINHQRDIILAEQRFQEKLASMREMESQRQDTIRSQTMTKLDRADRNMLVAQIKKEKDTLERQLKHQAYLDRVEINKAKQAKIDSILTRINTFTKEATARRSTELTDAERARKLNGVKAHLSSWEERIAEVRQTTKLEDSRRADLIMLHQDKLERVERKRLALLEQKRSRSQEYNKLTAQRVGLIKAKQQEQMSIFNDEVSKALEAKLTRTLN